MSQNGGDASKVSSPGRARHQITRSISEISSPIRLHRHQSHRAIKDSDRDTHSPAPAPQSAVAALQARRSFEVSRSEGATPNLSPNASRRTSVLYPSTDEVMQAIKKVLKDNGIAKEVVEEQQLAMARESGLQRSLAELETFANSTTKQLDDSYYSVLARLNSLQNTIAALQELAEASRQLNNSFTTDADELVTDINSQLDAFGQFEDQQQRIGSLQSRIHAGRDLIRSLSERVDAVSERIESWERADKEWQEKTRKRLKAGWVVTSVVVFLLLALFVGVQYAPETGAAASAEERTTAAFLSSTLRDAAAAAAKGNMPWSSSSQEAAEPPEISTVVVNTTERAEAPSLAVEMLRAFDEL